MTGHHPGRSLARTTPVMLLRSTAQHAVKARLRGKVHATVRQTRHDLTGRQAGKLRTIRYLENLLPFSLTQFVARWRPPGRGATIGEHRIAVINPALESAQAQAQLLASCLQSTA